MKFAPLWVMSTADPAKNLFPVVLDLDEPIQSMSSSFDEVLQ